MIPNIGLCFLYIMMRKEQELRKFMYHAFSVFNFLGPASQTYNLHFDFRKNDGSLVPLCWVCTILLWLNNQQQLAQLDGNVLRVHPVRTKDSIPYLTE